MQGFYGGQSGQSFKIKKIFRNKSGTAEEMLENQESMMQDLELGWSSPISVGEYVFISYGLQCDTTKEEYNYNLNIDLQANNKSYNSTLWQKIYTQNDIQQGTDQLTGIETYISSEIGLGYLLISSSVGEKGDSGVWVSPEAPDPKSDYVIWIDTDEEDSIDSLLSSRWIKDNCANAFKGTVIDKSIIIEDISPIQHTIDCRITSKNPKIDFTNLQLICSKKDGSNSQTYIPQADGIVKNIYSLYPDMKFTINNDDVLINIVYNKDSNLIFKHFEPDLKMFNFKGNCNTAEDLPVSQNVLGDAYAVGLNLPYDIYIWSNNTWINFGKIQGPKGLKGDQGDKGEDGASIEIIGSVDLSRDGVLTEEEVAVKLDKIYPMGSLNNTQLISVTYCTSLNNVKSFWYYQLRDTWKKVILNETNSDSSQLVWGEF